MNLDLQNNPSIYLKFIMHTDPPPSCNILVGLMNLWCMVTEAYTSEVKGTNFIYWSYPPGVYCPPAV